VGQRTHDGAAAPSCVRCAPTAAIVCALRAPRPWGAWCVCAAPERAQMQALRAQPLTPRENLVDFRALDAEADRRHRAGPVPGVRACQRSGVRDELEHALEARWHICDQPLEHRPALEALGHARQVPIRRGSLPGPCVGRHARAAAEAVGKRENPGLAPAGHERSRQCRRPPPCALVSRVASAPD